MMDNLRAAANHVVLKVILALIIISFVLTGVGNYLIGGSGDYAAKVDGQEIGRAQLEQAVQNERSRLQQQLGDQFSVLAGNEGYMKELRKQVLSRMIDDVLLDQYAKKLNLAISDAQVKEAIRAMPYFQSDNHFDNAKYLDMVARLGLSPDTYAQLVRQQLVTQQLIQGFTATGFTLPAEVNALAALTMQQRQVSLATIDISKLMPLQQVSDAELQGYYQQHQSSFIALETVKVRYIEMDAAAINDKMTVSNAEISAYYDQHKGSFTQPARSDYSVIQVKTEAEAKAIAGQLASGADFATLAKEKSTDIISRKNGGELGWLEQETTPDEIRAAKLSHKGDVSAPIASSVGYLIVRLNGIQPAVVKPLSEVRAEIADKVKQQKALDAFYALQQKVSDAATNDNDSLAGAEDAAGVKATETGWFSRDSVPQVLDFKPITQAIFDGSLFGENGTPGSNSDVISVEGDRAFVLRVSEHKPEAVKPFDQVRDQVTELLKRQKAIAQARSDGEKLLAALQAGKGEASLKAAGLRFGAEQTLTRASEDRQLTDTVFAMPHPQTDKPVYGISTDRHDNIALIRLNAVTAGHLSAEQMKAFASQMLTGETGITFDALMDNLRDNAKIKLGAAADVQ
ncbi:peptidylprolyl isomerase [Edwardsiella ictaluri]|uniref:peptidylprolyl isomerase n=1 Tax=Edwardsiella ictaluri TaxID=67780 RepID=UPI0009BFC0F4|nr:peptidylprolyl isomerase [Edwardsiella ictaluri]ARD40645.1 peptidylprolyl isomerase [Edwardsiella ictaluri]QPW26194.1 peptidylprolyl isomerase [Edwardsiella ictaluri]